MTKYDYIMGYSKANGNQKVMIHYFSAKTLQELQKRAEQVRAKGCIVHKFGRHNQGEQLAGTYDPRERKYSDGFYVKAVLPPEDFFKQLDNTK